MASYTYFLKRGSIFDNTEHIAYRNDSLRYSEIKMMLHRDFGKTIGRMKSSSRFLTAINHSSVIYEKKALCTWIPKNGCSNLRYSIAVANGVLDSSHDVNWIHANNDAFRPEIRDCYDIDYSFVILRCPLERVVSSFLNKMIDDRSSDVYHNKFKAFFDPKDIKNSFTFVDFIRLVTKENIIDEHWQAQSEFLLLDRYGDYFDVSNFHKIRNTLKEKIDFELKDTRSLLKHDLSHYSKVTFFDADHLTLAELHNLKSRGFVPTVRSFISQRVISSILEFWRSDFELFRCHFAPPCLWTDLGIKL